MSEQMDKVLTDINAKLEALGQATLTDAKIREIVKEEWDKLTDRKMKFAGDRTSGLEGTKYGRLDMTVQQVELLHALCCAAKVRGTGRGPSEELRNTFEAVGRPISDAEVRAMDTAESGYGSQLIGAGYASQLWEAARKQSRIMALIEPFDMKQATEYLPVEVDMPEPILMAESTANNSSNYGTQKTGSQRVSVTASKLGIHQMYSGEMEEDSIIPFVKFLQRQASLSLAHYGDAVCLLGDTTNAGTGNLNLDDANPPDTKWYLAFDGIVKGGLLDNTNNASNCAGAPSLDKMLSLRKLMLDRTYLHDWSHPDDPSDLVFVCDPETADALATNEDDLRTVDKYGAAAVVLTGEVAKVGRHSLLSTIAMGLTEADGKASTTGTNNTLGRVVAFNKRAYVIGWKRHIKVETERLIGSDQNRIVYTYRLGMGRFTPTGAASGIESAAVLYNITV